MSEYKILINCGIGDCIIYKSQFIKILQNHPDMKVFISPNETVINMLDKSWIDKYRTFIYDFCRLIYTEPNYVITNDQTFESINPIKLFQKTGVAPYFIDLSDKLLDHNFKNDYGDYVIIHTKVKGFTPEFFNAIKPHFIDFIKNNINCKIILMGEKQKIFINNEISLPQFTFNLYNDLISALPGRIIDLTISDYTVPNMNALLNDMNIMSKAKTNIMLGWPGSLHIATSVGIVSNLIDFNLTEQCWGCGPGGFYHMYYEKHPYKYSTGNYNNFKNHIVSAQKL